MEIIPQEHVKYISFGDWRPSATNLDLVPEPLHLVHPYGSSNRAGHISLAHIFGNMAVHYSLSQGGRLKVLIRCIP